MSSKHESGAKANKLHAEAVAWICGLSIQEQLGLRKTLQQVIEAKMAALESEASELRPPASFWMGVAGISSLLALQHVVEGCVEERLKGFVSPPPEDHVATSAEDLRRWVAFFKAARGESDV